MEINGKKLAWAIIHLQFFLYIGWTDFGASIWKQIIYFILMIFFVWRFIENMEETFG